MKKGIVLLLAFFALVQGTFGQTEKQLISEIDKIVLEIKNNKENYRKIISEVDSILNIRNQPSTITETAFKKGDELKIVQYYENVYDRISDYYLNNGELILIEIENSDNTYDKKYYNEGKIIVQYVNGIEKEMKVTEEDLKKMETSILFEIDELIKRYKNK